MIKYINKPLEDATEDIIIHGCNCFHTMGAGVAKALADKYPQIIEIDESTSYGDKNKLGTASWVIIPKTSESPPKLIINAYIQYRYGRDKKHLDLDALEKILAGLSKALKDEQFTVAMPFIGCGLAGGDWDTEVLPVVEKYLSDVSVTVYHI